MNSTRHLIIILTALLLFSCGGSTKNQVTSAPAVAEEIIETEVSLKEGQPMEGIVAIPVISSYYMKGAIDGKFAFTMLFQVDSCRIDGSYKYNNQKESITIAGTLKDDKIEIKEMISDKGEYVPNGAYFDGHFDYTKGQITGTWHSADGKRSLPFTIKNFCGKGYPQFDFKVNLKREVDESGYVSLEIDKLLILNKKTGEKNVLAIETHPFESTFVLYLEDLNFDGYQDIAMMEFMPAYPPHKYLFLLYDPSDGTFGQSDVMDEIYTYPYINYSDSTIHDEFYYRNTLQLQDFKFKNGKWKMVNMTSEDLGNGEEE